MKIAVCLSGETRNFNRVLSLKDTRGPIDFVNELKKFYSDVNVYGHTWSHCPPPIESGFKFKKLQIDNQSIIDDWVKQDFLNRSYSNRSGWNLDNKLADMSPQKFVNLHLARSRAAYGQVFSAFKCFNLVPLDTYDIVIRYRWDLQHQYDTEYFENTIIDRIKFLIRRKNQNMTAGVGSSNTTLYTGTPPLMTMEDTFFMFNQLGHSYIRSVPIEDRLERVFESCWGNEKEEAHSLWASVIFHPARSITPQAPEHELINFYLHLPNMFQLIRFQDELNYNPKANQAD